MGRDNQPKQNRRNVMRTGVGILTLATVPSLTAGKESRDESRVETDPFTLKDGDIKVEDASTAAVASTHGSSDDEFSLEEFAKSLNEEQQKGKIELVEKEGMVYIELTSTAKSEFGTAEGVVQPFSHGKNNYKVRGPGFTRPYVTHVFHVDDENTQELEYRIQQGAIGSGFITALAAASGAGTIPSVIGAAITAALQLGALELGHKNKGHGVVIKVYQLPTPNPGPDWVSVSPQ
ncbi:hypothetical protein HTG_06675 [Natrinema mahii]|nr:hypothetical protein HTG_06675 [Natrinema mahii]